MVVVANVDFVGLFVMGFTLGFAIMLFIAHCMLTHEHNKWMKIVEKWEKEEKRS